VGELRQAGQQQELPRGLLARAELYRAQGEFDEVQHDLDEAMTIAERGEMGLYQADCYLICTAVPGKGQERRCTQVSGYRQGNG
jgi:hypothetical protein